jgi:hypothetical protein
MTNEQIAKSAYEAAVEHGYLPFTVDDWHGGRRVISYDTPKWKDLPEDEKRKWRSNEGGEPADG